MSLSLSFRLLRKQPDHRLLALAAEGHHRAFDALAQRYRPGLLAYCRHRGFARSAEDVLQQALMDAWIALQRGTEVRDCRAWLYRIVHNTAVRQHQLYGELHAPLGEAVATTTALEAAVELRLEAREALASVAALPSLQREALVQTVFDGRSNDQVAASLGVSGAAIRGLVYRARTALRAAPRVLIPPAPLAWLLHHRHMPARAGQALSDAVAMNASLGEAGTGAGGFAVAAAIVKLTAVAATTGALIVGAFAIHHHAVARVHDERMNAAWLRTTTRRPLTPRARPAAAPTRASDADGNMSGLDSVAFRAGAVTPSTRRLGAGRSAAASLRRSGSSARDPATRAPQATGSPNAPAQADESSPAGSDSPAPMASAASSGAPGAAGSGMAGDSSDAPASTTAPAPSSTASQSRAVDAGASESSGNGASAAG